jgi:hypothetical protein
MANDYFTLLDIAKLNADDQVTPLIEANVNVAPELNRFPAITIPGTSFTSLIRTTLPTPGFRNVNEGVYTTKEAYATKIVECAYLDAQIEMDRAAARANRRGEAHALQLTLEAHVKGALLHLASQIWYGTGTGGDAKGFPGAVEVVDSTMVVDAGGTTGATGSSVYAVKFGPAYAELVFGEGSLFNAGEWRLQTITRSSKELTAWKSSLEGYAGISWINPYALGRIKKLTADSTKTLTDVLLATLYGKFPAAVVPDAFVMSKRSLMQLQASRTATGPTGAPAPIPNDWNGIPLIVTDSLINTEALTL